MNLHKKLIATTIATVCSVSCVGATAADNITIYLQNANGIKDRRQLESIENLIIIADERQQPTFNTSNLKIKSKFFSLMKGKASTFGQCGSFDPSASIGDAFSNGRLNALLDTVATNAVGALQGLGGALIKQSDPGLYEFLENGINIGFDDYLSAMNSCEKMQDVLVDNVPDALMVKTSAAETLSKYTKDSNKVNIVNLVRSGSAPKGEEGVTGVDGTKYGGSGGQKPLEVVSQTVLAGWCSITEKSTGDCSNLDGSSGTSISSSNDKSNVEKLFPDSDSAKTFANSVVGEVELRSCEDCEAIKAIPSQSISQVVTSEAAAIEASIKNLLTQDIDGLSNSELAEISADSYKITRSNLQVLQLEAEGVQSVFVERLAYDVATARTIDKVIALRQTLITGRANANLIGNPIARDEIDNKLAELDTQLTRFEQEVRLRNSFDSQTRLVLESRKDINRSGRDVSNLDSDLRRSK